MSVFIKMKLYFSRTKPFYVKKIFRQYWYIELELNLFQATCFNQKKDTNMHLRTSFFSRKEAMFLSNKLLTITKWSSKFPQFTVQFPAITEYFKAILHDSCTFYAFSRSLFNSSKIYPAIPAFTIRSRGSLVIFEAILQFKTRSQIIHELFRLGHQALRTIRYYSQ